MYQRILVATDGSTLSKKAVNHAIGLAALCGAELVALKVPTEQFADVMKKIGNARSGDLVTIDFTAEGVGVSLNGEARGKVASAPFARALLKDAPILVLDEATASLDSETESLIQSSLDDIMADKTVLVVAHRLSTLAHLDRIVVLDKGQIVEDGSHLQLLQRQGLYYRLWQRQSNGLLSEADRLETFPVEQGA